MHENGGRGYHNILPDQGRGTRGRHKGEAGEPEASSGTTKRAELSRFGAATFYLKSALNLVHSAGFERGASGSSGARIVCRRGGKINGKDEGAR